MPEPITAAMLYDLVHCPHRVTMDLFGDTAKRDPVSPFVELLWERGNAFEQQVIEQLRIPFTNLRPYADEEKERLTLEALRRGDALIYGGRIRAGDLLGDPDLLRRHGAGYVAGDIKSGRAEEGATEEEEGKPKKHYAVQLALYTDILERLGLSAGRTPFVWDVRGEEVTYDLNAPRGVRTPESLWDLYQSCLSVARAIASRTQGTLSALISDCKLCHWRTNCTFDLERREDLTLIPELGRARRDAMLPTIPRMRDLAGADARSFIRGKKTVFPGVGPEMLRRFQARAKLQITPDAQPYLKAPLHLPEARCELYFDVETDPMRDVCYLHGFVERFPGVAEGERYVAFFAERPTPEDEERTFREAWKYVARSRPCALYYYSPYERSVWRKLREKHPSVVAKEELDALFEGEYSVDLYRVVREASEWPTRDFSVKTLACQQDA